MVDEAPAAATRATTERTEAATAAAAPTLACETHTAVLALAATEASLEVGDAVTVTLRNEGCVALWLPQYRLRVEAAGIEAVLAPAEPELVVHTLAVAPGDSDAAQFAFQAVAAGRTTVTASASFEVHLGYPGLAYWGTAAPREPLVVTVGAVARRRSPAAGRGPNLGDDDRRGDPPRGSVGDEP